MIIEGFYQTIINQQCIITRPSNSSGKRLEASLDKPIECYRLMASRHPLNPEQLINCWQYKIDHQLKFISSVNASDGERVIAVSVLGSKQDKQQCELSVAVNEQWVEQGLAEILCKKLLEFTQQYNMHFFYSDNNMRPRNQLLAEILDLGTLEFSAQHRHCNNETTHRLMSA